MKSTHKLCALAAVTLAACQLSVAPDPSAGLGPVATVSSALADETIGQLFPAPDGLWAFIPNDDARKRGFDAGMLVAFGGDVDGPRNLFGVVAVHEWGVSLQRLDADPPGGSVEGSLIPISQTDPQTAARWGFCLGDGDVETSDCIKSFPYGHRWAIYPVDSEGRLVIDDHPMDAPTLPIQLTGQLHRSELGTDLIGWDLPSRWLAVPSATPGPRPTLPRIALDGTCSGLGSTHRDAMHAAWLPTTITPPKDALQVSSEAVRLGADMLVWCTGGDIHVGTPSLYRPQIPVIGRNFSVPPLMGATITKIPKRDAEIADWIVRLGAALSTGDWATADFIGESAVRTFGKASPLEAALVDSMSGISEGGRPEAAARLGAWGTRLQWNQKNSPGWQLGMARVETLLGNRKAAISRTAGIIDVLDRGRPEQRAFVAFFSALPELGKGAKGRDALDQLKEHTYLELAARAERGLSNNDIEPLRAEFETAGATDLFAALSGEIGPLPCDRSPCVPDSYGRIWANGEVEPKALSSVGRIDLRPGYEVATAKRAALEQLEAQAALLPLLSEEQTPDAAQAATTALVDWASAGCKGDPSLVKQIGADSARRHDEGDDAQIVTWLSTRAVDVACGTAAELATAAQELGLIAGRTDAPAALFAQRVADAADADLLPVLRTAAQFAAKHERGERCARWTLALAAAYTDAKDVESAHEWAEQALRCEVADRTAIDFIAAYLNFQRTSSTAADFDNATRSKLLKAVHAEPPTDSCVGAEPVGYQILREVPDDVRQLALRLSIPNIATSDQLSLVTANDRLMAARDHMKDVITKLDARDFKAAAASLGFATGAFESLSHEVGIARTRWVDAVLFDGRGEDVASEKSTFAEVGLASLRKKGTLTELASSDDLAVAVLAVLRDSAKVPELGAKKSLAHRPKFCEAPPRRVQGVAIDTVGGELKDVRGRGELEVELADPDEASTD